MLAIHHEKIEPFDDTAGLGEVNAFSSAGPYAELAMFAIEQAATLSNPILLSVFCKHHRYTYKIAVLAVIVKPRVIDVGGSPRCFKTARWIVGIDDRRIGERSGQPPRPGRFALCRFGHIRRRNELLLRPVHNIGREGKVKATIDRRSV